MADAERYTCKETEAATDTGTTKHLWYHVVFSCKRRGAKIVISALPGCRLRCTKSCDDPLVAEGARPLRDGSTIYQLIVDVNLEFEYVLGLCLLLFKHC